MVISNESLRPRYSEATPEQLSKICNGVGASWMPTVTRKILTKLSEWYFDEACWNHHDFGYYIGHVECHRREYDSKFFSAMLRDALKLSGFKMLLACNLSLFFFICVRCFGWASFYYANDFQKF